MKDEKKTPFVLMEMGIWTTVMFWLFGLGGAVLGLYHEYQLAFIALCVAVTIMNIKVGRGIGD